jgi:hypothetical protein
VLLFNSPPPRKDRDVACITGRSLPAGNEDMGKSRAPTVTQCFILRSPERVVQKREYAPPRGFSPPCVSDQVGKVLSKSADGPAPARFRNPVRAGRDSSCRAGFGVRPETLSVFCSYTASSGPTATNPKSEKPTIGGLFCNRRRKFFQNARCLAGDAVLIAPVSTQIPCYTATP